MKTYIQPQTTETNVSLATVTMQTLSDMINVDSSNPIEAGETVYGDANDRYTEWEEM